MSETTNSPPLESDSRFRASYWLANLCLGAWFAGLLFGYPFGGAIHLLLLVGGWSLIQLARGR